MLVQDCDLTLSRLKQGTYKIRLGYITRLSQNSSLKNVHGYSSVVDHFLA